METTMRQTWAFLFRGYHLTRRYIGWVVVFNFYAVVTSATVALIGVAAGNYQLTLTLVVGALLWKFGGFGPLGRLPGDISVQKENFSFHFPIVTCLLLSLVLTVVMWLFRR